MPIRNPMEWAADASRQAGQAILLRRQNVQAFAQAEDGPPPSIRRIDVNDLRGALAKGFEDFGENRADVILLCLFYPLLGLIFARLASGGSMLPLVFPLASGFALLGPLAGVGLYEMSRRRERGEPGGWPAAFGVARLPSFGSILALGLLLTLTFLAWLASAWAIYALTLGPQPPASAGSFIRDVLTTPSGWAMIAAGVGTGFVFAVLVLSVSIVSFPMILDRNPGVGRAVATSIRATRANPKAVAAWGLIVAGGLVLGSVPLFLGLVIVLPVLGHATWHLYRKLVAY